MGKKFKARVFLVEKTMNLKGGRLGDEEPAKKEYTYGAIRVQSQELNRLAGKVVEVTIREIPRR